MDVVLTFRGADLKHHISLTIAHSLVTNIRDKKRGNIINKDLGLVLSANKTLNSENIDTLKTLPILRPISGNVAEQTGPFISLMDHMTLHLHRKKIIPG